MMMTIHLIFLQFEKWPKPTHQPPRGPLWIPDLHLVQTLCLKGSFNISLSTVGRIFEKSLLYMFIFFFQTLANLHYPTLRSDSVKLSSILAAGRPSGGSTFSSCLPLKPYKTIFLLFTIEATRCCHQLCHCLIVAHNQS